MNDRQEVRKQLVQKISERSKECERQRHELCEKLNSNGLDREKVCGEVDHLCAQYKSLGALNGELLGMDLFSQTVEKVLS